MKKFFFALILAVSLFSLSVNAQELSAAQKDFRDKVEQFIKNEGYVPSIDPVDESVTFKYEGKLMWILVEEDGPFYIEAHIGGFDMEDINRNNILEACNYINATKRWGKAFIDDDVDSVIFTVEFYCADIDSFKTVFSKIINILSSIKSATQDYYLNLSDK